MEQRFKRVIEMIPGLLVWGFIAGMIGLSIIAPTIVAYIVVFYSTYFIYEAISTTILMLTTSRKVKRVLETNWLEKLDKEHKDWREYYHAIVIPFANEGEDVLRPGLQALVDNTYPKERKILVLATEARLTQSYELALKLKEEFKDGFAHIYVARHTLTEGEIVGKASNENSAARELYAYVQKVGIDPKRVILTSNDCDCKNHTSYMARLTYCYLSEDAPEKRIYQPIPMFFNNIWDVPFISRIIATFSAQWQMALALKPHRYVNFSAYAVLLESLHRIGYWDPDIIPEDERLFWRALIYFGKDMRVVPIFIPVLMDAVKASTYVRSLKEQYMQIRRWAYGASELAFSLPNIHKHKDIPLIYKAMYIGQQIRKSFEWAVAPFILLFGLSIPTYINPEFAKNILAYSLPVILSKILTIGTALLIAVFYIEAVFAPPKPTEWSMFRKAFSIVQWVAFPFVSIVFSALPALDAQTRLLIGKPLQYKVTEKAK